MLNRLMKGHGKSIFKLSNNTDISIKPLFCQKLPFYLPKMNNSLKVTYQMGKNVV